jgi:uncharacterized protein YbcI
LRASPPSLDPPLPIPSGAGAGVSTDISEDQERRVRDEHCRLTGAAPGLRLPAPDYGTTIDGETVVVILQDSMTKAERSLVEAGKDAEVLQLRRSFQETMRVDLVAVVERLTAANVQVFMSANHIAPDTAAEIFLLDAKVGAATE